jgi:hypothetical protein
LDTHITSVSIGNQPTAIGSSSDANVEACVGPVSGIDNVDGTMVTSDGMVIAEGVVIGISVGLGVDNVYVLLRCKMVFRSSKYHSIVSASMVKVDSKKIGRR